MCGQRALVVPSSAHHVRLIIALLEKSAILLASLREKHFILLGVVENHF